MGDPESVARALCLRALTGAPKTRQQLADLLAKRGVPGGGRGRRARPVRRGRPDRRRGLRARLGQLPAGRPGAGPAGAQGRAPRQGGRPRGGRRGGRGGRRRRRAGGRPAAGRARGCGACAGSTGPPRPGGWSACWPARATAVGWLPPWSGRRWTAAASPTARATSDDLRATRTRCCPDRSAPDRRRCGSGRVGVVRSLPAYRCRTPVRSAYGSCRLPAWASSCSRSIRWG